MNIQDTSTDWALQKFGIGQPVRRTEDPHLVRGHGRYTDDINLPGQVYAAMVRSRHAHGAIKNIDVSAVRGMPGVLGVYTAADLGGLRPAQMHHPAQEPRRQRDAQAGAPRARDRQGAVRRRSGCLRGGRDSGAGARGGRGRGGRGRAAAGGDASERRGAARRSSMTTRPATSRSTTTTAISKRSRPPSRAPPM